MPQPNPSDSDEHDARLDADAPITVDLKESDLKKSIKRTDPDQQAEADAAPARATRGAGKSRTNDLAKRFGRLQRQFDQRLAENEAKWQRELRDRDEKIERLSARRIDTRSDADEGAHDRKISDLEAQLADAMEKGESTKAARLQSQISEEHARYMAAQTAKQMGEAYDRDQEQRRSKDTGDEREPRRATGPTRLGRRFIGANADWWDDPDYRIERMAAVEIDKELLADDELDPNEPEYYEELQARLEEKFPDLDVELPTSRSARRAREEEEELEERPRGRQVQRPVRGGAVSAAANRGNDAPRRRNGVVRLNAQQLENMRAFNLDPENDKHVSAYAAEVGN